MKIYVPILCFAALAAGLFPSCEKDEGETDPLINSSWKVAMTDDNPDSNPPGEFGMNGTNTYHPWMNCQQDDSFIFGSDGRLLVEAGAEECEEDSSPWAGSSVSYEYDREKGEIIIDGIGYTIAELSGQRLKLYTAIPTATGMGYLIFLFQQ